MVDKIFEIIEYFEPKYWWIENPATGRMKEYIKKEYPKYNTFYDIDYCKYSNWGYQKKSRFWTNIKNFIPKLCKKDCENIIQIGDTNQKIHMDRMGTSKTIIDNGKIIRVNTKKLREKYKDYENLQKEKKHKKDVSLSVGGGPNRLERYRIPKKIIIELLEKCK